MNNRIKNRLFPTPKYFYIGSTFFMLMLTLGIIEVTKKVTLENMDFLSVFLLVLVASVPAIYIFLKPKILESNILSLIKERKRAKRFFNCSLSIFLILIFIFIGFVLSFFISPPPPLSKFKPFLQEEQITPVQIISEEDADIATFHVVYSEDEGIRMYLGAWNRYLCVYRKSTETIKRESHEKWVKEFNDEIFSKINLPE